MAGPLRFETASLSDVGRLRAENEDHFGEFTRPGEIRLLVVADGMGGHQGGATASRLAVEAVGRAFSDGDDQPEPLLRAALETANACVHARAADAPALYGMGTTCVALLLAPDGRGCVAHVGDSRAYRLRGGRLDALTSDHSVVAELVRRGVLSPSEALIHPRRNELLRSIGVEPSVAVDTATLSVEPGDRFLLCSDGLCGVVPEDEIAENLAGPVAGAARKLVDLANACGGPDNVTVIVTAAESA